MKTVYLNDSNLNTFEAEGYFKEAACWARDNCKSFVNYNIQDVSDVSYNWDYVAEYIFRDVKDAIMFTLKYVKQ